MLRHISHKNIARATSDALDSYFHFSFADYYNPENIRFGVLRVLNDDIVQPYRGFTMHPHRDMEILSYVVEGELTHADNMDNKRTLTRGQVQYMSAGTGVLHSEHNRLDQPLRFLQIWFLPERRGLEPAYKYAPLQFEERENKWLAIAAPAGAEREAPVRMHTDCHVAAIVLNNRNRAEYAVSPGRQAYLVLVEGEAVVNGVTLSARDALEVSEEDVQIEARPEAHALIMEMAKG